MFIFVYHPDSSSLKFIATILLYISNEMGSTHEANNASPFPLVRETPPVLKRIFTANHDIMK
jgi:hypothetical protein